MCDYLKTAKINIVFEILSSLIRLLQRLLHSKIFQTVLIWAINVTFSKFIPFFPHFRAWGSISKEVMCYFQCILRELKLELFMAERTSQRLLKLYNLLEPLCIKDDIWVKTIAFTSRRSRHQKKDWDNT